MESLRRVFGVLTLGFAAMGFVAVPIFDKPALQHVSDFLARPDVKEAEAEARKELDEWSQQLVDDAATTRPEDHALIPDNTTPLSRREQRRSDKPRKQPVTSAIRNPDRELPDAH